MSSARRAGVILSGMALALLAVPLTALPASAHDALLGATPGNGATVTSVDEVVMTFSGDPIGEPGANLVQVKGPDGLYYETSCPDLRGPDVHTPATLGPAGTYEVIWRIVSSDGHPVSGEYSFTYAPAATATSAPGSASPACAPAGAATAAPAPSTSDASSGVWLGVGIGSAAIIVVALGVWLLLRRPPSAKR